MTFPTVFYVKKADADEYDMLYKEYLGYGVDPQRLDELRELISKLVIFDHKSLGPPGPQEDYAVYVNFRRQVDDI